VPIDTHCHLGAEPFDADRAAVIARARRAGVTRMIVVADSAPASRQAGTIAEEFDLYATAGVHPHEASSWCPAVAAEITECFADPRVVAVGETGLDYHYDHSPRETQRAAFADQLALGVEHHLPVVIHSRSADRDMVAMLADTDATCILHSFSSGPDLLAAALDRDAYISFSGMVTFKSWKDLDAVRAVPDHRLLIETDSPYLAPVPHRGQRNEPAFVIRVAERVAEIRGTTPEAVATLTTHNAARCFGRPMNPDVPAP